MSSDHSRYDSILQKLGRFHTLDEISSFLASHQQDLDQDFFNYVAGSAFSYQEEKNYDAAMTLFVWGELIAKTRGDDPGMFMCEYFQGLIAEAEGLFDFEEQVFSKLMQVFNSLTPLQQKNGDVFSSYVSAGLRLASLLLQKGEREGARNLFSEIREKGTAYQSPNAELTALINLVYLCNQEHDLPSMRRYVSLVLQHLDKPLQNPDPYELSAPDSTSLATVLINAGLELYYATSDKDFIIVEAVATRVIELAPQLMQGYYLLSLFLLDQKKYAEALPVIEKSIQLSPEMGPLHLNLSVALIGLNDYERALQALDRAISIQPNDSRYYHNRAVVYGKLKKFADAIKDYTRALALLESDTQEHTGEHEYGKDVPFEAAVLREHLLRLQTYMEIRTPASEIPDLEWMCSYRDPVVQSMGLFYKGKLAAASGDFPAAAALLSQALDKNPHNMEARLARIAACQQLDRVPAAFEDIGVLVEEEDGLRPAYSLLAGILEKDAGQPLAHKWMGKACFRVFGYLKADYHYREALKLLPDDHQLHYWMGMNLIAGDDLYADIDGEFQISRAEQEEWVRGFSMGRVMDGIDEIVQALRLSPGQAEYQFFLRSVIDRLSGDQLTFTLVLGRYAELLADMFPRLDEAAGYYRTGEHYAHLRNFDRAIQEFEKAQQILENLKFNTFAQRINLNLADAYLRKGQLQTAMHFAKVGRLALSEVVRPMTLDLSGDVDNIKDRASLNFRDIAIFHLEFALFTVSMAQMPRLVGTLLNAEIAHRFGKYSEAADQIGEIEQEVVESYQALGLSIQTIISMVTIYRDAGKMEKALGLLDRLGQGNLNDRDRIMLEITRGNIYGVQEDIKNALEHYLKADELAVHAGISYNSTEAQIIKFNLASMYSLAGEDQKALEIFEKFEPHHQGFSTRDQILLKFNKALIQFRLGDSHEALASVQKAIEMLENLRLNLRDPDAKMSWIEQYLKVYDLAFDLSLQCDLLEEALNYIEQSRSRAFTDLLSTGHVYLSGESRQIETRKAKLEQVRGILNGLIEDYNSADRPGFVDIENIRKLETIGIIGDISEQLNIFDEQGHLSMQQLAQGMDAVEQELDRLADLVYEIKLNTAQNVSGKAATFDSLKTILNSETQAL